MNFTGFYGRFVFDKKVLYFPIMVFWPGNQARKSVASKGTGCAGWSVY